MSQTILDGSSRLAKVYFINLDRKPDRRKHIESYFPDDQRLIRIPAVDGLTQRHVILQERPFFNNHDLQLALDYQGSNAPDKVEPQYGCYDTDIHFAVMGNAISHVNAWKRVVQDLQDPTDVALIMQDDAIICPRMLKDMDRIIADMPKDAHVLWLSRHLWAIGGHFVKIDFDEEPDIERLFEDKTTDITGRLKDSSNPCSLAYLVTRRGAQWLLDMTPCVDRAMDYHMNTLLRRHGIHYATYRAYVTSDTKNFRSDIFVDK